MEKVCDDSFYNDSPNEDSETKIKKLNHSDFILNYSRERILSELLPIFQSLEYSILYINKFKPDELSSIPS